jgi:hypothetical protein
MIIENQSNLKVHFAGVETLSHFWCTYHSQIKYHLFTVYPFIKNKIKSNKVSLTDVAKTIYDNSNHTIMDSGLFTLMFGSEAGKKDKNFIYQWANLIIDFVQQNNYNGTVVEVDCQKVLGVENAWELRRLFKEKLNNRIINVFHKEDGQKGLDKLIEFSDYIAISVPELRAIKKKSYCVRLANYIKNKKPSIDIHLLGCTENKLLRQLNFCSTSDSTSWLQPVRYGGIDSYNKKILSRNVDKEKLINKYGKYAKQFSKGKLTEKGLYNYCLLMYQCELLKYKYSIYAGNQD